MYTGPSVPCPFRYSQIACVMARMWASVNVPWEGVPRCPLVPKLTSWLGSLRSGWRSKYCFSSRAGSINISRGAGLPARGDTVAVGDALTGGWVAMAWDMDHLLISDANSA